MRGLQRHLFTWDSGLGGHAAVVEDVPGLVKEVSGVVEEVPGVEEPEGEVGGLVAVDSTMS